MQACISAYKHAGLCAHVSVFKRAHFAFAVRAKLFLHLACGDSARTETRCTAEQNGKFEHEMSYRCGKALDFEAGT